MKTIPFSEVKKGQSFVDSWGTCCKKTDDDKAIDAYCSYGFYLAYEPHEQVQVSEVTV